MAASTPTPDPRRPMFVAAAVLFVAVALGVVVVALVVGDGTGSETSPTTTAVVLDADGNEVPVYERPSSLPQPNSGRAPQDAGDPGGWEQGLVFGLLVAGLAGIGFVVFRGTRKTRARRAEWLAAAERDPLR